MVLGIAALGGLWASWSGAPAEPRMHRVSHTTYVVRQGDTLWGIATRLAPDADPRPLIDGIEEANGVDAGSLVPGQQLVIPAA